MNNEELWVLVYRCRACTVQFHGLVMRKLAGLELLEDKGEYGETYRYQAHQECGLLIGKFFGMGDLIGIEPLPPEGKLKR